MIPLSWMIVFRDGSTITIDDGDVAEKYRHTIAKDIIPLVSLREANAEVSHWVANHNNQVRRNRILFERFDLPVERIKAYREMESIQHAIALWREAHATLQKKYEELQRRLKTLEK